ncbi:hypothetical protein [Ferrimonas sp.]|uniref:hypothetical protein n=1 Tax=Ferrimonas sp. TaxID=2080861 RepID=UPI003A8E4B4C
MNCTNCQRPLNADELCPRCDLKQIVEKDNPAPIPGERSVWALNLLGTLVGIGGTIGAFYLLFTIGLVEVGYMRKEIDPIGLVWSLSLLISSLFWIVLARVVAGGVKNTIWIRKFLHGQERSE